MRYAITATSATAKAKVNFTTDFELYYTNYTWAQGYTVELNNIGTNQTYNYSITSYGGTLGTFLLALITSLSTVASICITGSFLFADIHVKEMVVAQ